MSKNSEAINQAAKVTEIKMKDNPQGQSRNNLEPSLAENEYRDLLAKIIVTEKKNKT